MVIKMMGSADATPGGDDRHHFYLREGMGGHAGLLTDFDADVSTEQVLQTRVHDAFGVPMTGSIDPQGLYGWRGQEGSRSGFDVPLVEMQARSYDPTLGRFLQQDSLPIASLTTQGMNRYIYCENDPVNMSDPSGMLGITSGPAIFGAINAVLAIPWGLGYMVGFAAWFGLNLSPLAAMLFSTLQQLLWNLKGQICRQVLREHANDILESFLVKIGLRMLGLGLFVYADTIALSLGIGFAYIAVATGTPIAYYAGYYEGILAAAGSTWGR